MDAELFRKTALQSLATPEQLDQTLEIASPRPWIALGAAGLVLAMLLLWSVFGVLPDSVSGEGVIIRNGGVFNVVAGGDGVLAEFAPVAPGDPVRKGQVMGRISQPALALQAASARDLVDRLQAEEQELAGLIARSHTSSRQDAASQSKRATSGLAGREDSRAERLRAVHSRLDAARLQWQALELQHRLESTIVSEFDGVVVELMAMRGENLRRGEPVLSVEVGEQTLEVMIYIPQLGRAKRIKPGMAAQISPSDAASERYGYMVGQVASVSKYPATQQGMMAVLHNDSLVRELSRTGPPLAVRVRLEPDATSASGYQWSTQAGRKLAVTSGTIAAGTFIIEKYRPISLLIPRLKEAAGL